MRESENVIFKYKQENQEKKVNGPEAQWSLVMKRD
jgi:hypothetical protein